jgi:hypothetical protein
MSAIDDARDAFLGAYEASQVALVAKRACQEAYHAELPEGVSMIEQLKVLPTDKMREVRLRLHDTMEVWSEAVLDAGEAWDAYIQARKAMEDAA